MQLVRCGFTHGLLSAHGAGSSQVGALKQSRSPPETRCPRLQGHRDGPAADFTCVSDTKPVDVSEGAFTCQQVILSDTGRKQHAAHFHII